LTSLGYNGGATLNYQYDSTQRTTTVNGSGLFSQASPLFSNVTYGPVGLLNATLGTNPGLAEARTYNNRTRLNFLQVGSGGSIYSLTSLNYSGNGNVTAATDSVNGNWSYTYDAFNRLATAQTPPSNPTLGYSYSYDRFGNRWRQTVTTGTGWGMSLNFNANNQITGTGYQYDATGNLLMDGINCYTYDAENRLSSVAPWSGVCGATTMSYLYDPDGRRVARLQSGAVVKQYYYDAAGTMITEANASGATLRAEIYAGSRHLATWTNNATYFNHADWLGTERVRTNSSGSPCETITSLPFGDGQTTAGTCTPTHAMHQAMRSGNWTGLKRTRSAQKAGLGRRSAVTTPQSASSPQRTHPQGLPPRPPAPAQSQGK
jgi:YD repeat-containing protein